MITCTYTNETVYSTETSLYEKYEKQCRHKFNRVCIDGKITGCGNCVGYCRYDGHPGFLTDKHRRDHQCVEKNCFHYVEKPARMRKQRKKIHNEFHDTLLSLAKSKTGLMEGLLIINANQDSLGSWQLGYITISNEYTLSHLAREIRQELGCDVEFDRLNYSFDRCVQLIMAG